MKLVLYPLLFALCLASSQGLLRPSTSINSSGAAATRPSDRALRHTSTCMPLGVRRQRVRSPSPSPVVSPVVLQVSQGVWGGPGDVIKKDRDYELWLDLRDHQVR